MKKYKIIILIYTILLIISNKAFTIEQEYIPITVQTINTYGMGNAYTALSMNQYAPFWNPASYNLIEYYKLSNNNYIIPTLDFAINTSIDMLSTFFNYNDIQDSFNNINGNNWQVMDKQLQIMQSEFLPKRFGYGITPAIYSGYMGKFPYFSDDIFFSAILFTNIQNFIDPYPYGLSITVDLEQTLDAGIITGISYKLPFSFTPYNDNVYVGTNIKFFHRFVVSAYEINSFSIAMEDINNSLYNISGIRRGFGFGSDLGILWIFENLVPLGNFHAAIVVIDWFSSPIFYKQYNTQLNWVKGKLTKLIYPTLNIGIGYVIYENMPYTWLTKVIADFDIKDIISKRTNFFNRIGFGIEATFIDLLKLRMGLNKGYGTVGFGIDLYYYEFNFAYWVEEKGNQPGQKPQNNIAVNMVLKF